MSRVMRTHTRLRRPSNSEPLPRAEVTDVARADLAKPDLGLGVACEKAIRCGEFVCVDLVMHLFRCRW